MKHNIYSIRDTCVDTYLLPMFFINSAAAVRSLGDVVNKPSEENQFYQHPEHYQLYHIGVFDDENGQIEYNVPKFIIDCQSLVKPVMA